MAVFKLLENQEIKADIHQIWDFISSPKNLKFITPEYMGFDIISDDLPDKMYQGMIIKYQVKPILCIKLNWLTEITHVEELSFFVDEQRAGPYRFWHHQHHLVHVN